MPVSIIWWNNLFFLFFLSCLFPGEKRIKDNDGAYLSCIGTRNVLYIESATYGPEFYRPCNNMNVKSVINEQCHGKGRCHIITSNVTIGVVDPCPRKSKVLTISYRCMAHTG